MAQTSGFDPTSQVKTCFDCKMFNVACLNGENGPGGTLSHEALSVSSQGALGISSVAGQPPSLDRNNFCTPRLVAEPHKRDERCRPSSQRPQYPTIYIHLKRRLGRSLRSKFYKGSVVRPGKKATNKRSRVEGGLPGPLKLQGPVPEPNSAICNGQLNSGSLPSHPHPLKLKEVPKVLPQVTGVPVHLPSLRASQIPTGLYNDCKRSEADTSTLTTGLSGPSLRKKHK